MELFFNVNFYLPFFLPVAYNIVFRHTAEVTCDCGHFYTVLFPPRPRPHEYGL